MKIFKKTLSQTLAALMMFGAMAYASAAELVTARDASAITSIARGFGSASLEKDSAGDPKIVGRIDGTKYAIYFFNCSNNECDDIQFYAGFGGVRISLDQINEWNKTKRFGRAYLDSDNDPVIEMDVNLDNGVTHANLEDTFDFWTKVLKAYREYIQK